MGIIEPTIDMESFLKDVKDGMSAYNLQDKYTLTPRQYRYIMRGVTRQKGYSLKKTGVRHGHYRSKFHEPFVTKRKTGKYLIRKGDTYYGQYDTLEIARQVKKGLVKCNWDKTQLNSIRKGLGLKPLRRYRYVTRTRNKATQQ